MEQTTVQSALFLSYANSCSGPLAYIAANSSIAVCIYTLDTVENLKVFAALRLCIDKCRKRGITVQERNINI